MRTQCRFTPVEVFDFAHRKLPVFTRCRAAAFTLIEMLIVVAILAILVTILVPVVDNYLEDARAAKCMSNLRNIKTAIDNKLAENNGNRKFGLIYSEGDPNSFMGLGVNDLADFFAGEVPVDTNAMQNVWAMVANYDVSPRAFICPSDSTTDRPSSTRYGWTDLREFSYGIQYPYGDYGINDARLKDRTVIMADRNPGGAVDGGAIKHSNHPDGVAVLFYDGNVKFYEADDSKAGYRGDEIYTNTTPVAGGAPTGAGDTSITPCPSR